MINAIIIDDEKRARLNLSILIKEYCPQINIIAECENLPEGVKSIRKNKPDLIFLDIEMPGHSGLELLDFFDENEINFKIIFTTAYQEYAIQAFKFSAIDYLLKPINPEELIAAATRFSKEKEKIDKYAILKENLKDETFRKIAVPSGNSLVFIEVNDILFIKGEGAYSEIHFRNNEKLLVSRNLKNFEDIICEQRNFIRIHKSFILNTHYIKSYNKSDGGSIEIQNGLHLPIGTDKIQTILETIEIIKR
ncbi:LytR/AlgR family response regulator transcription factor [Flavobacterium oreochromis]|uniref:LytR/AlgR family response regulator transcription factor n=1 Tax=Flavobacterium oreochromis TaxID=2906078 RepID=UPI001CE4D6C4|nr:response regulator [Flavobacterium oreochromis]QYS87675.1 response regulator [Flavobacterium oreochromis]